MGNVALMMRQLGHEVSGADTGVYPPMSDLLAASGITVYDGYSAERLASLAPDCVVVGNVISRGHPEMEWLLRTRALPYVSMPALLNQMVLAERNPIVVAGTHGKTTTATLAAYLLRASGVASGHLIGGVPRDLPNGADAGEAGQWFVIEGDEYDSAFFDKRSKFIHYCPRILVLNNLEFDHADIFRDLDDVKRTFSHLLRLVPDNGMIVVNADDANLATLLPVSWAPCLSVGVAGEADLRITGYTEDDQGSRFALHWRGRHWATVEWGRAGLFNARNAAMAALAVGLALHPDDPTRLPLECLAGFQGVKRRQDCLLESAPCVIMEDFGHHPTAIDGTLESLRHRYPDHALVACFEPRSNTARTRVFQETLPAALAKADRIYLGPVHRATSLSSDQRLDLDAVVAAINGEGSGLARAAHFADNAALKDQLLADIGQYASPEQPWLVCFFTNGAFDGIVGQCVAGLR